MNDKFAGRGVVDKPHVENVYGNAAIEQVVDEFGTFSGRTSETVKFGNDKSVARLQSLNQVIKARTFGSCSSEFFDDKFIEADIFKLGDLLLKSIAVTRLFASGNTGISKLRRKASRNHKC